MRDEPALEWRRSMPPGFSWPAGKRAAACFTFDVDAESPILFEHPESAAWLDVMSHQAYGPRTGVPRLLRVLDRHEQRGHAEVERRARDQPDHPEPVPLVTTTSS